MFLAKKPIGKKAFPQEASGVSQEENPTAYEHNCRLHEIKSGLLSAQKGGSFQKKLY